MKNILLFTLPLVGITLIAQDLKTSVNEVLSTNPIVLERLQNYNSTKTDITVAQAGYYPSLDLKLGGGLDNLDNEPVQQDGDTLNTYEGSLRYTQNIFKGFETSSEVDVQKNKSASAAYSYIEKANDTSFKMVDTYLKVMKNIELEGTSKKNVEINEKILVKVQKLYETGLTTLSEVNKIKSSLSLARTNLMVQENTLRDSQYSLKKVLGKELDADAMSKPILSTTFPLTLDEALAFAKQNNPSLLVSDYNIKLAKAAKEGKKSFYYPALDLELSALTDDNGNGLDINHKDEYKAMAYISYNIFRGFSDQASLEKSTTYIQQEIQKKHELQRQVEEGMNLSWLSYSTLQDQLDELEEYKKFSLKTLELYSKEYELGRRSLLDLLTAQNDYIGAQAKIITTDYNLLFAKYRVLDSMGTLVSTVMGNQDYIDNKVDFK